jgi:hypothetical protein
MPLLLAGGLTPALGQEAIQMSIAGADAAEARRKAATTLGYYNLKMGPTAWNFGAGLGIDYNSNVNLTETNPQADFIFRPQIDTRMIWPVSTQNSITLALGGGYSAYINNPGLDRLYITPGSELSFDVYAGDFLINLHDRFSISEASYQDPSVAATGYYSQFQNAVGVAPTWDLNKAIVKFGYDHVIYETLNSSSAQLSGAQPSGHSEVFFASGGYSLKPAMLAGVELGGSLIHYDTTTSYQPYSDAIQWNVGGFFDSPVTDYIHFTAHAGYTVYEPQAGAASAPGDSFNGMYAQIDIRHRLNQYVDYGLSGGRTINVAFYGGTVDQYFVVWQANWHIVRKLTLSTPFTYFHGTQLYTGGETYDQYGPGINLSYPLTAKLTGNLGYQYYLRYSNLPDRNYTVNVVSLNLYYRF